LPEIQKQVKCPKCKRLLTFTFRLPEPAQPKNQTAKGLIKTGAGTALVGGLAEMGFWPDVLMGPIMLAISIFLASQFAHVAMPWMEEIFGGDNE
jgi:hypothetical protein